ncbi:ABC transporter substrate-binding protein [Paenibacillus sp. FJAT-26967]|uniref:ABC transporter substrate-binding protein n=1 Tax=Paenibacillus sp. FJAT-26967 TaxID=1729690 RepID=UPI0008383CA3|nr:ABC transporter substrate-binding protein [Paenibacillus sp. FJAT-26967]
MKISGTIQSTIKAIIFILLLSSCAFKQTDPNLLEEKYTGEDSCGNKIEQNLKLERMVLLYENQDELMNRLNLSSRIIPWDREQAGLKAYEWADLNEIQKAEPDAVIALSDHIDERACLLSDKLGNSGIQPLFFEAKNIRELQVAIRELGVLTGRATEAKQWVEEVNQSVQYVRNVVEKNTVKKVYWELSFQQDQANHAGYTGLTLPGTHWLNDVIKVAGGINIAEDESTGKSNPYVHLNESNIVEEDPDVIYTADYSKASTSFIHPDKRSGWSSIKAVKNRQIFEIKEQAYRLDKLPETITWLAEHLHPEVF